MPTTHPRVSIVLPTFNGSKYIKQSIDSCLNQTYPNIELIIVDDCSTDNTPEIIKSYKDKRITYLRHGKNQGLPRSLNTGFAHASGDYLAWTSDDNYYAEQAIEKELSFLIEKNCSFVYCDYYKFTDENPSKLDLWKLGDSLALDKLNGVGPCILYSRNVKEAVGEYDPEIELAEDYDYWIRVSKKFPMRHLAEPLYFYREHPNSLTTARFYEVRVAEILAKSKNQILNDKAINYFIYLCARKYPKWFWINRAARILLKRKVLKRLQDFESGKSSLKETRKQLMELLNSN